ncbi:MAG TPA: tyrosine-type recombinase/integrase [Methanocella sp.]|nr:tyrosine-type recombinase/integrase [Methanocella sp.]
MSKIGRRRADKDSRKIQFRPCGAKSDKEPFDKVKFLDEFRKYLLYGRSNLTQEDKKVTKSKPQLSPYYVDNILSSVDTIIRTYGVSKPTEELSVKIKEDCAKRGRSKACVRNYMYALKYWAEYQGFRLQVDIPRPTRKRQEYLNDKEMEMLLAGCRNVRDRAIIKLFVYSGIRPRELVNLDLDDYRDRTIYIRDNHSPDRKYPTIKTDREDAIPVGRDCDEAIREYLEDRPLDLPTKALFITDDGKRMNAERALQQIVKAAAKRGGLTRNVYPYMLRHTAATSMIESGVNLYFVSKVLRHSTLNQTDTYVNLIKEAARRELDSKYDGKYKKG